MLPVGGVRLDQPPVVGEDRVERLGPFGGAAGKSARSDPGSIAGKTARSRWSRGSRPSRRRRRAPPPGTPRAHVAGQRLRWVVGSRIGHAPECTEARLLDGVADRREDVAQLRAQQDQGDDRQGSGQTRNSPMIRHAMAIPPRHRTGPNQGGIRQPVVQALLGRTLDRRDEQHDLPQTRRASPRSCAEGDEDDQELAESDPSTDGLLDDKGRPSNAFPTWILKSLWPGVDRVRLSRRTRSTRD